MKLNFKEQVRQVSWLSKVDPIKPGEEDNKISYQVQVCDPTYDRLQNCCSASVSY